MNRMGILAIAALAVLSTAAPAALAQSNTATFTAKESGCGVGKTFCFDTATTSLTGGKMYTFTLSNPSTNGAGHNLCISVDGATPRCAPGPTSSELTSPGNTSSVQVEIGSTAKKVRYFCQPHDTLGMNGEITVQSTTPPPPPPPTTPPPAKPSPDVGLVSIALGIGLLAVALRRR